MTRDPDRSICLSSRDNGVGLSRDIALLTQLLEGSGYDVRFIDWQDRKPRSLSPELTIFLELLNPRLLGRSRRTVGVFNPEWFDARWRGLLPRMTQLWAKSEEAERIFKELKVPAGKVHRTGFLSKDLYDPAIPRELRCVHVQGNSGHKSTDQVVKAWQDNPDLPPLTIVSRVPNLKVDVPNVTLRGYLPEEELVREMNRALIHVCPSQCEGWGHYIAEALSVKGVVVTTDASPMNEHVSSERGYLISPERSELYWKNWLAMRHWVTSDQIAAGVRWAVSLSDEERGEIGDRARLHFLSRNREAGKRILELVGEILG